MNPVKLSKNWAFVTSIIVNFKKGVQVSTKTGFKSSLRISRNQRNIKGSEGNHGPSQNWIKQGTLISRFCHFAFSAILGFSQILRIPQFRVFRNFGFSSNFVVSPFTRFPQFWIFRNYTLSAILRSLHIFKIDPLNNLEFLDFRRPPRLVCFFASMYFTLISL